MAPLARALLGRRGGDLVDSTGGQGGTEELEILAVDYDDA